jgi:chromosome partitioning protein
MATTISVNCQKGGVGKTTCCLLLGYNLAKRGYKTLMIDFDSQGNLSYAARAGQNIYDHTKKTSFEAVKTGSVKPFIIPALHATQGEPKEIENLFLVPAEDWLSNLAYYMYVEWRVANSEGFRKSEYMYLLKHALNPIQHDFDYILIDCPPSPGEPTRLALAASDWSLIIMQSQIFCFDAVGRFAEIMEGVQKQFNPVLDVLGIVPTLMDSRANLDAGIVKHARAEFGDWVTDTIIHSKTKVKEIAVGIPVNLNKKERDALDQYNELTCEVLRRCQTH